MLDSKFYTVTEIPCLPQRSLFFPRPLLDLCIERLISILHFQKVEVSDRWYVNSENVENFLNIKLHVPWSVEVERYEKLPIPRHLIVLLTRRRLGLEDLVFDNDI